MASVKPQNDRELSEAVSAVVQEANKLNRLMSEGMLYEVCNSLNRIEHKAWQAKLLILDIADLAG